jgi:hypothetical protein
VGPAGVFTVNTKNHSGKRVWVAGRTFLVSGSRQEHIRNSEFEGTRAAKLLGKALGWPVPMRPVIAVLDPQSLSIKKAPSGVDVVEARRLVRWLKKRPAVLGSEAVAQIVSVIGEPQTWGYVADGSADLDRRVQFGAIHATVSAARRVRTIWLIVIAVTVGLAAVLVGPELLAVAVTELLGGSR